MAGPVLKSATRPVWGGGCTDKRNFGRSSFDLLPAPVVGSVALLAKWLHASNMVGTGFGRDSGGMGKRC